MKQLLIMLCIAVLTGGLWAQDTIRGSYVYTYGDSESLIKARQTCKDLAVRDAIESYFLFVESSTEVENNTVKEDIIQSLSAGYLKDLKVVDQSEEGRTISTTVEAMVNPGEVQALVEKMSQAAPESASATVEPQEEQGLETLLDAYQKRMEAAESSWNRADYVQAYAAAQDIQKLLEAHRQRGATPFQKALYLTVHKRTVLIKHLIELERAEKLTQRRIVVRSQAKEVAKDALQLKDIMIKLKAMTPDSEAQVALRDFWLQKSQATLDRAKGKIRR